MLTAIAGLLVLNLVVMTAGVVRLYWWAKVSAHLGVPVRFGTTAGLRDAWRILNAK